MNKLNVEEEKDLIELNDQLIKEKIEKPKFIGTALYDYDSPSQEILSFKKGNRFFIFKKVFFPIKKK